MSFIQSNYGFTDASPLPTDVAFSTDVTADSLLVVGVGTEVGASRTVVVTDSRGNTYAQAGNYQTRGTARVSIWFARNATSGPCTVTVTPDTSAYVQALIAEYDEVVAGEAFDGAGGQTGSGTAMTSGVVPTTTASHLVVGIALSIGAAPQLFLGSKTSLRLLTGGTAIGALMLVDATDSTAVVSIQNTFGNPWLVSAASFKTVPAGRTLGYIPSLWSDSASLNQLVRPALTLEAAPDALPTAVIYKGGAVVVGAAATVTALGDLEYRFDYSFADTVWALGNSYKIKAKWQYGGVDYGQPVAQGLVKGEIPTAAQIRDYIDSNPPSTIALELGDSARDTISNVVSGGSDTVIAALPPAPDNAGISTLLSRLSLINIASAVWGAASRTLSAFGFTVNANPNTTELATLAKLQDAAPGEEPVVVIPGASNPSLCYIHGALRPARGGTAANVDVEFELFYDGPLKSGEILVERQFTLQTDAAGALSVVVDRNNSLTPSGSRWAITCEAAKIPRTLCNLTTGSFDIGSLIVES